MEGVASEAASLAGHLGLDRLIVFYDDNGITIDGPTSLSFSEDVGKRFEAYGWHVQRVDDGNDLEALTAAAAAARPTRSGRRSSCCAPTSASAARPSRTPPPRTARRSAPRRWRPPSGTWAGPRSRPSTSPPRRAWPGRGRRPGRRGGRRLGGAGRQLPRRPRRGGGRARPAADAGAAGRLAGTLPVFAAEDGPIATRTASGKVLEKIAPGLPELVGGSADLAGSDNTDQNGEVDFSATEPGGKNFFFGVREHAMGATLNGMALHGGLRPYGGTFLIFSDYMRPAIRLAALMGQPVIYVFTHDSIGLGEDGPTHQPVSSCGAARHPQPRIGPPRRRRRDRGGLAGRGRARRRAARAWRSPVRRCRSWPTPRRAPTRACSEVATCWPTRRRRRRAPS